MPSSAATMEGMPGVSCPGRKGSTEVMAVEMRASLTPSSALSTASSFSPGGARNADCLLTLQ